MNYAKIYCSNVTGAKVSKGEWCYAMSDLKENKNLVSFTKKKK